MSVIPERFAVMAIDPGGTSGVAQGLFNASRARTTAELLRRAVRKDALRVSEVRPGPDGTYMGQVAALFAAWNSFRFHANAGMAIPLPNVYLVIERFALRQRSVDLAPVEVTAGLMSVIYQRPGFYTRSVIFQEPSTAMTYATNERLRRWGVWQVGLEHGRDAVRHLALAVSRALDGSLL